MFKNFLIVAANDYAKAMSSSNPSIAQRQLITVYTAVNTAVKDGSGSMSMAVAKKYGEFISRYTRA